MKLQIFMINNKYKLKTNNNVNNNKIINNKKQIKVKIYQIIIHSIQQYIKYAENANKNI